MRAEVDQDTPLTAGLWVVSTAAIEDYQRAAAEMGVPMPTHHQATDAQIDAYFCVFAEPSVRAATIIALPAVRACVQGLEPHECLRLDAAVLLDRKQNRETVQLAVWRQGKSIQMAVSMEPYPPLIRKGNIYDRMPRYFIYAGLVFVPLNVEILKLFGRNWDADAPAFLRYTYKYKSIEKPSHLHVESVVLLRRLDHPINADMPKYKNMLVEKVNGKHITELKDLVSAIESNQDRFHVFEFESGIIHILDASKVADANAAILRQYGIPRDRRL